MKGPGTVSMVILGADDIDLEQEVLLSELGSFTDADQRLAFEFGKMKICYYLQSFTSYGALGGGIRGHLGCDVLKSGNIVFYASYYFSDLGMFTDAEWMVCATRVMQHRTFQISPLPSLFSSDGGPVDVK